MPRALLGTAGYGVFSYVITLAGLLTLFMDPGINGILIRDTAKVDEEERRTIFGTMFVMKIVLLAHRRRRHPVHRAALSPHSPARRY